MFHVLQATQRQTSLASQRYEREIDEQKAQLSSLRNQLQSKHSK